MLFKLCGGLATFVATSTTECKGYSEYNRRCCGQGCTGATELHVIIAINQEALFGAPATPW